MINVVDLQRQLDSELVNALSALLSMREYNPDDAFVAFPELSPQQNHTRQTTTTSADRNANHDRQPQPPTTRGYGSANHDR